MTKERLTAFTDAVLAIIMTILVLELKRPQALTWQAFWALKSNYLAYAISFFWLGAMWVNMHNEWYAVKKIDVKSIWATLIMLFTSSLFPYATDIVSEGFNNKVAQLFYGLIVMLISFANLWMYHCVRQANPENKKIAYRITQRWNWMSWDLIIKGIGLALSATIFAPGMLLSVLVTLLVLVIPNQFRTIKC